MPEKIEDLFEFYDGSHPVVIEEQTNKTTSKYKKIFKLFRSVRNIDKSKSSIVESVWDKNWRKDKKKKFKNSEERKEMLNKNIENSWIELPATLQRKKEKISKEILSEYHDADGTDPEDTYVKDHSYVSVDGQPEDDTYKSNEDLDQTIFDSLERINIDTDLSQYTKMTCNNGRFDESVDGDENLSDDGSDDEDDQNVYSEIHFSGGEGEIIEDGTREEEERKPGTETQATEDGEGSDGDDEADKNKCLFNAALKEMNMLFHGTGRRDSLQSSEDVFKFLEATQETDSAKVEVYENMNGHGSLPPEIPGDSLITSKLEEIIQVEVTAPDQSDSIESSRSDKNPVSLNQQETEESNSGNGMTTFKSLKQINLLQSSAEISQDSDSAREDSAIKDLDELVERAKTNSTETEQLPENLEDGKAEPEVVSKQKMQYTDVLFAASSISRELFATANEDPKANVTTPKTEETDEKIPEKSDGEEKKTSEANQITDKEKNEEEMETKKPKGRVFSEKSEHYNELTEEERAKKKSAEAIAKELTSRLFGRKNQKVHPFKNITPSETKQADKKQGAAAPGTPKLEPVPETPEKQVSRVPKPPQMPDIVFPSPPKPEVALTSVTTAEDTEKDEQELDSKNEQCISVADWWKVMAVDGETEASPPETETKPAKTSKLSVAEILLRFEELGNKHFSEESNVTEDERTVTLKEIHQILKCLEEKVRNFEKWNESVRKVRW
ncbi:hypothetical protein RUM43_004781 [Polyplax serrata]|uniref:Uncharacterized protein n=1 Tax=Polyplax serrata TaxID=468196 RepID=A0AAN8SDT6_POLSC